MKIYKISKLDDSDPQGEKSLYTQCTYCRKYRTEDKIFKHLSEMDIEEMNTVLKIEKNWEDLSQDFHVSHGICKDCMKKYYDL